ncbi:MAG: LytTR family DNA-binding domain-containing protein, partial [Pseudomonadota bacterium]
SLRPLMHRFRGLLRQRSFQSETALWTAAFVALGLAYVIQFQIVRDQVLSRSIITALINVVPIILIGVSIRLLVRRYVIDRPVIQQIMLHVVLALAFTHLWYVFVLLAASFRLDWLTSGIRLFPFYESATLWQLLQGIVIYAAMQGLIYGRWLQERLDETRSALQEAQHRLPETSNADPEAVFVKADGEFKKISLDDLIHLEADGDQVQLHTKLGRWSCHKPLSHYAMKLENSGYIRVHRSHLVSANKIVSAEPTGDGRLSIHLSNGTSIIASRTGTRAFKEFTA